MDTLPDACYYSPDSMKRDDRERFYEWYTKHRNNQFVLRDELLRYCISDVDILRKCCLKFRDMFMQISATDGSDRGVDPFQSCITIASACNLLYRRNFLEPETIAVIPPHGYRTEDLQSQDALKWIKLVAQTTGYNIQHARNGGEMTEGDYKLDGFFIDKDGQKTALEYHGCFWHGCPTCYARNTVNPVNKFTMAELHQSTLDKQKYLEERGYKYVCKWECEFKQEVANQAETRAFINNLDIIAPLDPREAFFGGRTEAFQLYRKVESGETINYYDVTSLYPFINKTAKYPVGHPEIVTENFSALAHYEGLVKCKVLPPRHMLIPVLPVKLNNKLMFPLCYTCAETKQQSTCTHADNKRAFVGTWVSDELKKAVDLGYEVQTIYEVWHFNEVNQYDPQTKTGGLFTSYIDTFAKLKQQASGWPSDCDTESKKLQYINNYKNKEGT